MAIWSNLRCLRAALLASTAGAISGAAHAQAAPPPETQPDTVVIVGSQIVGAKPSDALPVTVVGRREIDAIAAPSGDELFRSIPQLGDVGFNSASGASTVGGVNAARGDVASINLRALGTGNTLVLLNGRRMVNHPGVQVENSVPVVTVNANTIPVSGVDRVEVLLDGASAVYGADAVAGVVNTVLKSEINGLTIDLQVGKEQGVDAAEFSGSFEWGFTSESGRTNISLFGSYYGRDPIFASERGFSANADLRSQLPADWINDAPAAFNGTSATSAWGIFGRAPAVTSGGTITVNGAAISNAAGQFHLQPSSVPGCAVAYTGGTCFAPTSTRPADLRYNINRDATVQNGVDRENLYLTFRHRFDAGVELFGEAGAYLADSVGYREVAPMLSAVPIVIPASNYWNPFGPVTFANGQANPNRLPNTNAPEQGLNLTLGVGTAAYRPIDAGPRKTEVENLSTRVVLGLRGDVADWNWESALLYSQANTQDMENRISNTLFQQQLALSTPDAYNPFNGGCVSDLPAGDCTPSSAAAIAAITVPVFRRDKTSLASWDFKVSRPDALHIWSGDVGLAAGLELRREDYSDDRDPRQDGTVNFVDPLNTAIRTNDLMGQSLSQDTIGKRDVSSVWVELRAPLVSPEMHIPLVQNIDLQLAGRYEDFDTFGSVTKPKIALSWRPLDFLMFRSAWGEGFRAPNLQQQFETGLLRNNSRLDFIFCEAAKQKDPSVLVASCSRPAGSPAASADVAALLALGASKPVTSNRQGSTSLQPEESKNLTYGAVFEPDFLPPEFGKLSLTADWWRIEQTGAVGIFGDNNHILLDYTLRAQGIGSDSAVARTTPDATRQALFAGTTIAAVGDITVVNDTYLNLDQRAVQGWDFGLYYSLHDTPIGSFDFRANAAFLDKFFQGVSPDGAVINQAMASGKIASTLSVAGQGDLVKNFGRPEWRWAASLTWSLAAWQAGWFTSYVGDVTDPQTRRVSDGAIWNIESMQTHNLYVQYMLGADHRGTRLRLGVRNIFDEAPPLAATTFGYLGDIDNPAGRFFYGSIRKTF